MSGLLKRQLIPITIKAHNLLQAYYDLSKIMLEQSLDTNVWSNKFRLQKVT